VYCEEYGYIDRNNCPDGLEKDVYDEHSDYFIIRDSKNNIAATVRIIKNSQAGFPLEKNFHLNIETSNLDHDHLVEISRLIVARKYRKKLLLLFLVKGLYLYAIEQKITHAYFIIDEKLYPLLLKIKVPVIKIGTPAIYQGLTFPCLVDVTEWERNVRRSRSFNRFYYFGGMDLSDDGNKYEVH
jgi:N-acyl-L-homoserine lactone synthetase